MPAAKPRLVVPELLDQLEADDPRALRSRRDLRTVHTAMRSPSILRRLLANLPLEAPPRRIIELGAGDGSLMLRVAALWRPSSSNIELTLLDRVDLLTDSTRAAYSRLGWEVGMIRADVLEWVGRPVSATYDLCIVSLFLHHFSQPDLGAILQGIARRVNAVVCIEPRRSVLARIAAHCIGLIGASELTRTDAVISVGAGFRGSELGEAWKDAGWIISEFPALPFTHCFTARRAVRAGAAFADVAG